MTRIKICCISSIEEAEMAIENGVDAIGLVSSMPSGPGVISEDLISEISSHAKGRIKTFLLTSKRTSKEIIEQHNKCKTTTIQICDSITPKVYEELRSELKDIELVQVIHVTDESSVKEAIEASEFADALLLDSGNQKLAVKELGGTGRTHDWSISQKIVKSVIKPVFLAGGLNMNNVGNAVRDVNPYGVDVCSGVRLDGMLNLEKLTGFIASTRNYK